MTTSNPYHSINKAIRSRCQIYELYPLNDEDIMDAINKSIDSKLLLDLDIEEDAKKEIIRLSGSDLRYTYNLINLFYLNYLLINYFYLNIRKIYINHSYMN